MKLFIILIGCLSIVASRENSRKCPNRNGLAKLNINQYVNTWYYVRTSCPLDRPYPIQCLQINLSHCQPKRKIYLRKYISATARVSYSGSVPQLFKYELEPSKSKDGFKPRGVAENVYSTDLRFPHVVLGTDYKTYAVLSGCQKINQEPFECTWILTREPNPQKETIDEAMTVIRETFSGDVPEMTEIGTEGGCAKMYKKT